MRHSSIALFTWTQGICSLSRVTSFLLLNNQTCDVIKPRRTKKHKVHWISHVPWSDSNNNVHIWVNNYTQHTNVYAKVWGFCSWITWTVITGPSQVNDSRPFLKLSLTVSYRNQVNEIYEIILRWLLGVPGHTGELLQRWYYPYVWSRL